MTEGGAGWDGRLYDRVAAPQERWGATVVERLQLRGDETVLDCGCGSGRVTALLVSRLPRGRVIALDASPSMLDQARERLGAHPGRVSFVEADALQLTAGTLALSAPLDAVLSTATFHHIPDHPRLFANLAGVLRRDGQLVAQCGAEGNLARLIAGARRAGIDDIGAREYASAATTVARLESAGFVEVEVWTNEEPTRFDGSAQLRDFLEAVCLREPLDRLEARGRIRALDRIVADLGEPVLDYVRLNIVARRG